MIVNIRGNNGSGKSTLVREFLDSYRHVPLFGVLGVRQPEAYRVERGERPGSFRPLYVLGPYRTNTGGADVLSGRGQKLVVELLDKYAAKGHVIFEGVIISTFMGQIAEWLIKNKDQAIVAFLDTPVEECVASIQLRTGTSGRFANVSAKVPMIQRVKARMIEAGLRCEDITRQNGFEKMKQWVTP